MQVANREVDTWLDGSAGVSEADERAADEVLRAISGTAPALADVLQQAAPWGTLREGSDVTMLGGSPSEPPQYVPA